ncbi:hypothetical protein H310_03617 [Aphanomyces invadans]|nr:hypothetical protein H310_03617 [Aphanomyces invadans]ETW05998.1 hypothetical protein H310_03617 [Aphanomyces invadans]|eukprot:XP_008865775.1 hypothetical protein H310_03617 [Aphanomyces invadans]
MARLRNLPIAYVDDAEFICPSKEVMTEITAKAVLILATWFLEVKIAKLKRRKSLAKAAFSHMWKIWMRRKLVSESNRARLYKAYVLLVLLYNCGTWALTPTQLDGLEAFHRRQLRQLLGIFYPHRILKADLYARCHTEPLRGLVTHRRWRMFGHAPPPTPQYKLP